MRKLLEQVNAKQIRAPVRVLGCLQRATLAVIVCPENGFVNGGVVKVLPIEAVPFDLRMPNSEFDIVLDLNSGSIKVLPRLALEKHLGQRGDRAKFENALAKVKDREPDAQDKL